MFCIYQVSSSLFFVVLKSDSSNGVFGFTQATLFTTTVEGSGVSLLIDRSIGLFSSVDVAWEVRSLNGTIEGPIASDDFSPSSGVVTFDPNESIKVLPQKLTFYQFLTFLFYLHRHWCSLC